MPTSPLSRRLMLRGSLALGTTFGLALPVLDAMLDNTGRALAQTGGALPTRFGTWFFGGGVVSSDRFFPQVVSDNWQASGMLAPLANVRDYTTLVRGAHMGTVKGNGGHWHHRGWALSSSYYTTDPKGYPGDPPAASIDQVAAQHFKGQTRFDSLELGVLANGGVNSSVSWKAGHQIMRPDTDPRSVFMRLFDGNLSDASATQNFEAIRTARLSVLDSAQESAKRLSLRLGARDKQRIEAHLDGIREIEQRLQSSTQASSCQTPVAPQLGAAASKTSGDLVGISDAMADLLAVALACDLTRVFSFMFTGAQDPTVYAQLAISEQYHVLTHDSTWYYGNADKVVTFIMQRLGYLAGKLHETKEGDSTLLDRTLIYATSEFQDASRHSRDDHPFVLIGKAGGTLKGGRYLKTPSSMMVGSVMLAALQSVGVPATAVGSAEKDPESYTTEAFTALLG